jgi:uncharacterized protein
MGMVNIRSVTYSVDLNKISSKEYIENIQRNIDCIVNNIKDQGIFIRTIRFNILTQKSEDILDQFHFLRKVGLLEKVANNLGVRWFNISFDLNNKTEKQIKFTCNIAYEILKKYDKAFVNFLITSKKTISSQAALYCAKTIIKVSKLSGNGYDNFRLGVSINPSENTPFFPFSYALRDHCFSLAIETSNLIESEIKYRGAQDLKSVRVNLIKAIGKQTSIIDRAAKESSVESCIEYSGQDISLSPFPDEKISVISILRSLGLKDFGSNGSLFLTAFLTDVLKEVISRYKLKSTGFNGVMYSLLEDPELCLANDKKNVSIDSLILYSSVCGCGLDMVPVPGNILDEELASIILDVAALGVRLDKPLGVRVIPIPNGSVNEYTQFDMDFLTNTRILQIKNIGCGNNILNSSKLAYLNVKDKIGKSMESVEPYQKNIKDFWNKRADKFMLGQSLSATNLEENSELQKIKLNLERKKIQSVINIKSTDICLDLGCGLGYWTEFISQKSKKVMGVDYSQKMIKIAQNNARKKDIQNVEYICSDASEYSNENVFDFIFISGLLLYLSDLDMRALVKNINNFSKSGTSLILREPTGLDGRHLIVDKFSETLNAKYSAVYRTRDELISSFEAIGYQWQSDEDMFQDGSPLNKWNESRLRLYSFIKK